VIAELWWVMSMGATVLFALVMALLVLAFVRPAILRRARAKLLVAGGGLVLPGIVLIPLVLVAVERGERLLALGDAQTFHVEVLARQWEWVFIHRAPDGDLRKSVNVLHVPVGRPVRLEITSADVIHSFWVPRLGGKIDATPGHVTRLTLVVDGPGTYHGLCSEFCGTAHREMQMTVRAHATEAALAREMTALPPPAPHDAFPRGSRR
jgi:cytochrome c oxidase subunit II